MNVATGFFYWLDLAQELFKYKESNKLPIGPITPFVAMIGTDAIGCCQRKVNFGQQVRRVDGHI